MILLDCNKNRGNAKRKREGAHARGHQQTIHFCAGLMSVHSVHGVELLEEFEDLLVGWIPRECSRDLWKSIVKEQKVSWEMEVRNSRRVQKFVLALPRRPWQPPT